MSTKEYHHTLIELRQSTSVGNRISFEVLAGGEEIGELEVWRVGAWATVVKARRRRREPKGAMSLAYLKVVDVLGLTGLASDYMMSSWAISLWKSLDATPMRKFTLLRVEETLPSAPADDEASAEIDPIFGEIRIYPQRDRWVIAKSRLDAVEYAKISGRIVRSADEEDDDSYPPTLTFAEMRAALHGNSDS